MKPALLMPRDVSGRQPPTPAVTLCARTPPAQTHTRTQKKTQQKSAPPPETCPAPCPPLAAASVFELGERTRATVSHRKMTAESKHMPPPLLPNAVYYETPLNCTDNGNFVYYCVRHYDLIAGIQNVGHSCSRHYTHTTHTRTHTQGGSQVVCRYV